MLTIFAQRAQARWWFYAVCLVFGAASMADLLTFDLASGVVTPRPFNLYEVLEKVAALGGPLLAIVANHRGWAVPDRPAKTPAKRGVR